MLTMKMNIMHELNCKLLQKSKIHSESVHLIQNVPKRSDHLRFTKTKIEGQPFFDVSVVYQYHATSNAQKKPHTNAKLIIFIEDY